MEIKEYFKNLFKYYIINEMEDIKIPVFRREFL